MPSLEKTSHLYQTLPNASKTYKGWNYSANSIYDGGTITSALEKKTNGRGHSKHNKAFSNQKSCSLE